VAIETIAESRAESGPAEDFVANRQRPDNLRTRALSVRSAAAPTIWWKS